MASHWSKWFGRALSQKQASALDRMAEKHGFRDGGALLVEIAGTYQSKLARMSSLQLRPYIDEAFEKYGGESVDPLASERADLIKLVSGLNAVGIKAVKAAILKAAKAG